MLGKVNVVEYGDKARLEGIDEKRSVGAGVSMCRITEDMFWC